VLEAVQGPPVIVQQPVSLTANENTTASVGVVAQSSSPLTYQWLAAAPNFRVPPILFWWRATWDLNGVPFSVRVSMRQDPL